MLDLLKKKACFLSLSCLTLLATQACTDSISWQTIRTSHFVVYYTAAREETALRVADICEEWHAKLRRKMEYNPGGGIPVYLYPNRRAFADATGMDPADPVVGIAHTRTRKIRIDASGLFTDVDKVVPHELVHVFMSVQVRHNRTRIPLWFSEGLAKYLADDWTASDAETLADAAAKGKLLSLSEITFVFPAERYDRAVAYAQSYSFLKYIADQRSPAIIPVLLEALQRGETFESAFQFSVGATPKEYEEEWRQYLWEEYSLARWSKLFSGLASAVMAVLAILAFRARLIRKRLLAKEMESEGFDRTDE